MERTFSISEIAKEFEITPRTVRFYEDEDLIHPSRNGQSRVYTQRERVRLELILRGKRVGFSLAEIKELLDLYNLDDNQAVQISATLRKCRERIDTLEQQRMDIDATVAELEGYCDTLEKMLLEKKLAFEGEPA